MASVWMEQDADVDSLLQRLAAASEPGAADGATESHAAALLQQYAAVMPKLQPQGLFPCLLLQACC